MRRAKPQPIDTRLPRLRSAALLKRSEPPSRDHKPSAVPTPRVGRGKNFRLRNVHRD